MFRLYLVSAILFSIAQSSTVEAVIAKESCADFLSSVHSSGEEASYLKESLNFVWIKTLTRNYARTLSLLTGVEGSAEAQEAKRLAELAVKNGYIVFFDGDSPSAESLASLVGDRGVAITSLPDKPNLGQTQVISISNPFLRLKAFAAAREHVMTADAVTGWGLLFIDSMTCVIETAKGENDSTMRRWTDSIKGSTFGLRHYFYPVRSKATGAEAFKTLTTHLYREDPRPPSLGEKTAIRFDIKQVTVRLDKDTLESILNYKNQILEGSKTLEKTMSGGATVFGSGSSEPKYENLVYDVSRYISAGGLPIVTGGAHGFMKVANAAATDAGGVSIGIPMTGRKRLASEKFVASEVQTLTISTTDYSARIPLLLHMNKYVVVMPGGQGTMQEVGTAFFKAAMETHQDQKIIFVAKDFYGPLFNLLQSSSLPESMKSRLYLVDSPEQVWPIIGVTNPPKIEPRKILGDR